MVYTKPLYGWKRTFHLHTDTYTPHTIQCLSNMRERDSNAQLDENVCIPLVIVISLSWNQLWFWCCAENTRLNLVAHGIRKRSYFIKYVTIWTKEKRNDLNVVRSIFFIKIEYLKRNSKYKNFKEKNIHTKTKAGNNCIKNSTNSENVKSIRCYQSKFNFKIRQEVVRDK